jgi:transposase
MRPYSMDLRERVVGACDARSGTRERIAERFGVSVSWIRRMLQRRRETGSIAALSPNSGRKPKLNQRQMDRLGRIVVRHPDATLKELKMHLGVSMSDDALLRALGKLNLTLKKSRSSQRSKSDKI